MTFTASGVAPAGLPAGAVYYRFMNGAAVLQDWSTVAHVHEQRAGGWYYSVTVRGFDGCFRVDQQADVGCGGTRGLRAG